MCSERYITINLKSCSINRENNNLAIGMHIHVYVQVPKPKKHPQTIQHLKRTKKLTNLKSNTEIHTVNP